MRHFPRRSPLLQTQSLLRGRITTADADVLPRSLDKKSIEEELTVLKNKKFAKYAVAFNILGILFMFFYSGLQNDQINIIQGFSAWNNDATLAPMTVGNLVCIALTLVYGTCFMKFGVKKTLIPCIALAALGCLGIAAANGVAVNSEGVILASAAANDPAVNGIYWLYAVSLFIIRCTCMCLQMSGFQLAASWFIAYRGRVLGIITLGSPLFSVVGTGVFTSIISNHMGGDYRPFYVGLCVILVLLAVLVGLMIKDTPEQVGLYPDGADTAPKSEGAEEVKMSIGDVLKQKKSWIMIINYGAYQYIINCCMASMVAWFTFLVITNADAVAAGPMGGMFMGMGGLEGAGAMVLFVGQAVKWLSVGAIAGIGMSFIFGVIDDKLGTPIASLCLGLTEFLPIIGLMTQHKYVVETGMCNNGLLVLWGFGVACMTGGVPTMHPASISFAFGRREYQAANRVIMAIQLIPCAFAAQWMVKMIWSGNPMLPWIHCIIVLVIGIIFTLPMFKMEDANAADRALIGKK